MSASIKIIIADDESLYREWLASVIPIQHHEYEVVGEAEDGEEALALCGKIKTDIVITDIVMPRMDGIELTRKLQEKWPHIKVILLSNHREFEFARKAISYGAIGYMLKIASGHQELLTLLDQAKRQIEIDRDKKMKEMKDRYYLHKHIPQLRKQFVIDLINNKYFSTDDMFQQQFHYLGMHTPDAALTLVLIRIDHYA